MIIGDRTGAAGLGLIGGVVGGLLERDTKNAQMAGDWKLQNFLAQQGFENNRMGLNASLGANMSSNRWVNMLGPEADQLRQFTAAKQKAAFLDPLEDARERENARWTMGASLDPLSKKTGFEALLNANRRSGFDKLVASDAMFGPTGFSSKYTRSV